MNTFGRIFRVTILGESHGPIVGMVLDGCPPGISLEEQDFEYDLNRRKSGAPGTTPRKEEDFPYIKSGVFQGKTTGSPLTIWFENKNTQSSDYEKQKETNRPGHADFVLHKKSKGFNDYRGGGHSSGRLTVALVAAGVLAKKIIQGIKLSAQIIEIGGNQDLEQAIHLAIETQDSIGGIIECTVKDLPIGLGEPFFDSLESMISHAVFSIPAIKGIEFGSGFGAAKMRGSEHNDAFINHKGQTATNHAGGINGGISNGNELVFRVAVKPTSSTPKEQRTWNNKTESIEPFEIKGRHDLCIALRVPVVIEAVTAIVLSDLLLLEKAYQ